MESRVVSAMTEHLEHDQPVHKPKRDFKDFKDRKNAAGKSPIVPNDNKELR